MTDIPALTALADQFEQTARRKHRLPPSPRRRYAVVALALVLTAVGGFVGGRVLAPERVIAGAPLTLIDGKLALSYRQVLEDRAGVEAQLASTSLRITIEDVPASPSMVGRVRWGRGQSPLGDPRIDRPFEPLIIPDCDDERVCWPWWPDGMVGPDGRVTQPTGWEAGLLVPLDYDGETTIEVGRPATPDEPYDMQGQPLAPGEALGCRPILFATVADARRLLAGVNTPLVWRLNDRLPAEVAAQVDPDRDQDIDNLDAALDLVVENAAYLTDHSVMLWVRRAEQLTPAEVESRRAFEGVAGC